MTEEIHPLREIIKQQAAEIARLQGHIKHIGNDALRSEHNITLQSTAATIRGLK